MNFQSVIDWIDKAIPPLIAAILLLIVAIVAALIAKAIVIGIGKKLHLEKFTGKWGLTDDPKDSVRFIGKIVGFFVFLLFVPGILAKLGLGIVSAPITTMLTTFLNYLPNLFGAILILVVGVFIAKIVKKIVWAILKKTRIDKLQEKAGMENAKETVRFSTVISNIVYVLILIPVIIAALDVLKITSLSTPAVGILSSILNAVPNIAVAIALMVLGIYIAKVVAALLANVLVGIGTDKAVNKLIGEQVKAKIAPSKIIAGIVRVVIIILFAVQSVSLLNLDVVSELGSDIINYIPALLCAIIVVVGAVFLGSWLENLINKNRDSKMAGSVVKYIILVVAIFIALNQLGFNMSVLNIAFLVILIALAIAFAVSFGLGGREFASKMLNRVEKKMDGECEKKKEE